METNFREKIEMPTLHEFIGVTSLKQLNMKQRKAIRNIKYCANDQWQFVNSWYDERSEDARSFMMNAGELFDAIYRESLENVYDDGYSGFGSGAASFLKDIRFCGKPFLQTVVLYYTAKLMEESVPEVDGTDEDAQRVASELLNLKNSIKLYTRSGVTA